MSVRPNKASFVQLFIWLSHISCLLIFWLRWPQSHTPLLQAFWLDATPNNRHGKQYTRFVSSHPASHSYLLYQSRLNFRPPCCCSCKSGRSGPICLILSLSSMDNNENDKDFRLETAFLLRLVLVLVLLGVDDAIVYYGNEGGDRQAN